MRPASILRLAIIHTLLLIMPGTAPAQQALEVPSGQPVTLGEVLIDDATGELLVRFRFIAPNIGDGPEQVTYEISSGDMDYLCRFLVLPYLTQYDLQPSRVVISLSDRPVPFGATDPDATQYFDAYRPENASCIWEAF